MEIFKNKVGRPSNETLAKRKKIKIMMIVTSILVLGLGGIVVYKSFFAREKISSNNLNATTNIKYTVSGYNGGINVKGKYYATGVEVSESTIGDAWVLGNSNALTKVNVNIYFPAEYTVPGSFYNSTYRVALYDKKNQEIGSPTLTWKITKTKHTQQLSITNDSYYAMIYIKSSDGKRTIQKKKIWLATAPKVTAKTTGTVIENKADTIRAAFSKSGSQKVNISINNPNKITGYYRWVTFSDYTANKVSKYGNCTYIDNNKSFSANLTVNWNNPEVLGRVEIYKNSTTCKNRTGAITKFNVKYEMARTYNNNDGWQMLKYDIKKISQTLGSQPKAECLSTALAYGVYILSNGTKIKSTSASSTSYGAIDKSHSTKAQFFSTVKQKIDAGIPVVMKAKNNTGPYYQHFVLIVGYNRNKSVSTMGLGDIWVIDPYYDKAPHYNLKNIVLHENRASKRTGTIKDFYSGYPVKTWATTTSYK